MEKSQKPITLAVVLPWLIFFAGLVGFIASFILFQDHVKALKDPGFVPSCNLNPILSCSKVSTSNQASVFGVYNGFIGLPAYAAVMTLGVAMLAGAKFKRWFWRLVNFGLLLAVGFITWLQFETLYRINALCIFCMVIWVATIPLFWYVTLYNFDKGNLKVPKKLAGVYSFVRSNHFGFLMLWFLVIFALIIDRFWYYWKTLF